MNGESNKVANIVYNLSTKNADKTKKEIRDVNNELKSAGKTAKDTSSYVTGQNLNLQRITKLITSLALTKKIIGSIRVSADYIEDLNVLNVAFNNNTDEINAFNKAFSQVLNLDDSTLVKSAGTFKTLADSMGYAEDTGTKFSKLMSAITIDASSLYNLDFTKSQNMLQSAVMGQGRALQRATGASVLDTTVQTTLNTLGIDAYVRDMNFAEKSMARVIAITYQLNNAQGDLARTIESPANQFRILGEQVRLAARNIGNIFLPIAAKILPVLNAVMLILNDILSTIAKLVGYDPSKFDFGGNIDTTDLTDGFNNLGDSVEDVGNKAEETKKKMSGLRGFDKLNVINSPTSNDTNTSSGSGSSGGAGINPKLLSAFDNMSTKWNSNLDGIKTKADKIRDSIYDWAGITKDENGNLHVSWKTLGRILEVIGAIAGIIGGIKLLKRLTASTKSLKDTTEASKGLSKAAKKASTALEILATGASALMILGGIALVLKSFSDLLDSINKNGFTTNNVIKLMVSTFAALSLAIVAITQSTKNMDTKQIIGIVAVLGGLALVLESLGSLFDNIANSGLTLNQTMATIGVTFGAISVLTLALAGATELLSGPTAMLALVLVVGSLVVVLKTLAATLPTILDAAGKFIDTIGPTLIKVIKEIHSFINDLLNTLGVILPPIIDSVGGVFSKVFTGISAVVNSVGRAVTRVLNSLKSLVVTVLGSILNFVNLLGPAVNNLVNNVIWAVTKLINFMVSGMEYLVNNVVVRSINAMVKALNKVTNLFGSNIGYASNVYIPIFRPQLYEDGGFPTKGQLFIANEKRPELVGQIGGQSFVANQNQMMDILDKKLSSSNRVQNTTIIVKLGEEQVAKKVIKDLNNMARTNGKPITITG